MNSTVTNRRMTIPCYSMHSAHGASAMHFTMHFGTLHFLLPASQILGGKVRFWHDQVFCKPPRCGGPVAWHQDYSYWTRTGPMNHLTCWIALDDSDKENGCLHYIAGSHRWSLLPMPQIAGSLDAISSDLTVATKRSTASPGTGRDRCWRGLLPSSAYLAWIRGKPF